MKFNEGQQKAIEVTRNSVVLAGAGSGKTTVLAERFIHLIETKGVDADQILTLTFTKKAAAEMYERIYLRLRKSESPQAQKQLTLFDRAQISTIDSFCSQIVKNWSENFGIPGNFAIEEKNNYLQEASFQFILDNYKDESLKKLIRLMGFEEVWNGLFQSLAERYITLAFNRDFEAMRVKQVELLQKELKERMAELINSIDHILRLPPNTVTVTRNQESLRELPDLEELIRQQEYQQLEKTLDTIKLTKPGGKANMDIQIMKEQVDIIRREQESVSRILDTLMNQELIKGIFRLLGEFQEYINNLKRGRNSLGFQDVAHMAIVTLLKNKSLRAYYKKRFRYIMIDEFQDNNRLQKELLFLLSEKPELSLDRIPTAREIEEDKLFFVGDDKQSIYRFRGAEVSVFKELSGELTEGDTSLITLDTNYRSEPGLICFFNQLFKNLLGESKEPYEADFQELLPRSEPGQIKPQITYLYKPYDEEEEGAFDNDESEAYTVAEHILQSVQEKRYIIEEKTGPRAAGFGDFTVLMRSTSNQIIYERMFRLFNIPYTTQDVRSLFMEAPVNDMYNILQLALYPEDRLAYTSYLRSPVVNLSDDALIRILSQNAAPFSEETTLGKEDKQKYQAARELYEDISGRLDRCSLYALVHYLWHRSGYRYFLLKNPRYHNFLEYYHYLAALAEKYDRRGENLASFLDFVRENLGKYEKLEELEILKTEVEGVQLMTIHKSKGLEFPVVVLANMGNKGRNQGAKTPYWVSEEYGLTLNIGKKNRFQEIAEQEDEKQEIAELKRVLYVALTRARSHLILSGCHNRGNRNTAKAHLNMLRESLELFTREKEGQEDCGEFLFTTTFIKNLDEKQYYSHMGQKETRDYSSMEGLYKKAKVITRAYPETEFSVRELCEKYTAAGKKGAIQDFPAQEGDKLLKSDTRKMLFGTLTHYILEQKMKGAYNEKKIPEALYTEFSREELGTLLPMAEAMALNFLNSKLAMEQKESGLWETESPFLYSHPWQETEILISGVMDLYFETEETACIVDFKTDRRLDSSEYLFQLGLYYLAGRELTEKPLTCYLFPLRGTTPIPLELDETALTAELNALLDHLNNRGPDLPIQGELPLF